MSTKPNPAVEPEGPTDCVYLLFGAVEANKTVCEIYGDHAQYRMRLDELRKVEWVGVVYRIPHHSWTNFWFGVPVGRLTSEADMVDLKNALILRQNDIDAMCLDDGKTGRPRWITPLGTDRLGIPITVYATVRLIDGMIRNPKIRPTEGTSFSA
jgi:hypothetical protein